MQVLADGDLLGAAQRPQRLGIELGQRKAPRRYSRTRFDVARLAVPRLVAMIRKL